MRSLIQLAGRVRRHREGECSTPNIRVFDTNLRHFSSPNQPAFCKPGFETAQFPLQPHSLGQLMTPDEVAVMDARPRIVAREKLQPRSRLVDLEHARMQATMLPLPPSSSMLNAASWWQMAPADALLTAVLPQQQPFRDDPLQRVDLELRPNEDGDGCTLILLMEQKGGHRVEITFDSHKTQIPDSKVEGEHITAWGVTDYMEALTDLANAMDMPLDRCAQRFGTLILSLNKSTDINGWRFHPALGFSEDRS